MTSSGLYAHKNESEKELLEEHLLNVKNYAIGLFVEKRQAIGDIKLFEDMYEALKITTLFHDLGKATSYFQDYLVNGKRVDKEKKSHSLFGAIWAYYYAQNFNFNHKYHFPFLIFLAIKKHHGNLESIEQEISKLDEEALFLLEEQINSIDVKKFNVLLKNIGLNLNIEGFSKFIKQDKLRFYIKKSEEKVIKTDQKMEYYFLTNILFSYLTGGDKLTTAMPSRRKNPNDIVIPDNIIDEFKKYKFHFKKGQGSKINNFRNEIYKTSKNNIHEIVNNNKKLLSLNVPTGTGKTLAVLNLAVRLRNGLCAKYGYTPKIIYSLPFISVIDQNSRELEKALSLSLYPDKFGNETFKEIESSLLLRHHSLSSPGKFTEINEENDEELDIMNKRKLLVEAWESEIIFTTFVQLSETLISNRNRTLKRFHQLIGSIIILDEIQSIPRKYWELVRLLLKFMANNFNTTFIFMTATMPLIFSKEEVYNIVEPEKYFRELNRITLNIDLNPKDFNNFLEEQNSYIIKGRSYLFVFNTVKTSQEFFKKLKTNNEIIRNFQIFYLSTRIIPKHRMEIIEKIKKLMNDKANNIILVSTQLIEAGVDLDFGVVYRDLAPLDCINQTAGRCNRNFMHREKGQVYILNLINKGKYFYDYVYDDVLMDITKRCLKKYAKKGRIEEKQFLDLNKA